MTRLRWYSAVAAIVAILFGFTRLATNYPQVAGPLLVAVGFIVCVEIIMGLGPDYED